MGLYGNLTSSSVKRKQAFLNPMLPQYNTIQYFIDNSPLGLFSDNTK